VRLLLVWLLIDLAGLNAPNPVQDEVIETTCSYEWDCVEALSIAWCESYHLPTAFNGEDHGYFQINEYFWSGVFGKEWWAKRYEIQSNAAMAYHIWEYSGDFKLWTCGRK
tara:strand:- start:45 stop:374 length:330 start_codon:yes stop_codon:yes gene_type:complete